MATMAPDAEVVDNTDEKTAQDRAFFSFPYEPYDIQLALMRQIWKTIDNQHVGIFESPTGTGKSISLICGALSWLVKNTDEYGLLLTAQSAQSGADDNEKEKKVEQKSEEPSWLAAFADEHTQREGKDQQAKAKEALQGVYAIREKPSDAQTKKRKIGIAYNHHERKRYQSSTGSKKKKDDKRMSAALTGSTGVMEDDGEEHLVDAYDSDRVGQQNESDSDTEHPSATLSTSSRGYLYHRGLVEKPNFGVIKIIYCSRTHSQISQFIREINKTVFGENLRVISLGARKNLCTNPAVTSLRSDLKMTDKCLDMLQGTKSKTKKKSVGKCPYYDKELLGHYKDYALAHVHDIEDLHQLGEEMSICSYYGARESIPLAQLVAMPYSMVLSKDTRESMGIDLEGNIVIFDEAHNIIEAINNTYNVQVSSKQLVVARRNLWSYFKRYDKRLKGKNSFYIKQLLSILECLTKFLRQMGKNTRVEKTNDNNNGQDDDTNGAKMMTINDFLFTARIDHFNMFKILQYLQESDLPKKLMGFVDAEASDSIDTTQNGSTSIMTADQDEDSFESRHISPLRVIEAFLKALTSAGGDGRILAQPQNPREGIEAVIKFILLNPATHFQEIVDKARSVILAGGTMEPVSQVIDQLFSFVPNHQMDLFSCGHVIPPENLLGFSLSSGPTKKHLEFTYSRRNDKEALDELGRILLNLSRVVPGGIVVFFPSYRFEESTVKHWQTTKVFDEIDSKKPIFREPKQSDELASVLAQYSAACSVSRDHEGNFANKRGGGAMLLSVVGGKMSEGINFSDELARCIVMVGMPYPNARDPELMEKMSFLDKTNPGTGRRFYESLCMKAVNQSIGRSIRHQNDYSTILLIDHRYSNPVVRKQLPAWIQQRVQPPTLSHSFGQLYSQLVQFYRAKATTAT